jgi:glyoxylase-like metal-dependent hydrolase (beta-lactamase superfamily II)
MQQIVPGLWVFDEIGNMVHCYLWEWAGGVTLIDTGMPKDARTILDALVRNSRPLHTVRRILITHGDVDHTGGLAQIQRATRAAVACHTVEKVVLEHPSRRQPAWWALRPIFLLFSLLPSLRVRPVTPDELLVDGQALPEGFTVIHTPGHTAGHISLLHRERRILIAGDALNTNGGKLNGPPAAFTPDMKNAQRSIWKLAKKYGDDIDVIVVGHGDPVLQNGGKRIQALASQIFSTEV